jgi:ABC-type hemin transport system ATPase subunit
LWFSYENQRFAREKKWILKGVSQVALDYVSRIIIMHDGRIFADCSPTQVIETRVFDKVIGLRRLFPEYPPDVPDGYLH